MTAPGSTDISGVPLREPAPVESMHPAHACDLHVLLLHHDHRKTLLEFRFDAKKTAFPGTRCPSAAMRPH